MTGIPIANGFPVSRPGSGVDSRDAVVKPPGIGFTASPAPAARPRDNRNFGSDGYRRRRNGKPGTCRLRLLARTASSRSRRPWRTSRPLPPRRPPSGLKQVAPGQYPTSCLSSAAPSRAPGASRPRRARRVYAWRRAWWPQPARAPRRPARVGACPPSSTI